MNRESDMSTPFSVTPPENLDADLALDLFVNVLSDFQKVQASGHTMLNGPRGCGKSMMFRYLQPDCQMLHLGCGPTDLPFFAVLVSIRNFAPGITELGRLVGKPANLVLNEHVLTVFVASKVVQEVARLPESALADHHDEVRGFVRGIASRMQLAGWKGSADWVEGIENVRVLLERTVAFLDERYVEVTNWLRRQADGLRDDLPYSGALCGYLDFLRPVLDACQRLPFMPRSRRIYLLVDDADWLNAAQTRALNSWIASRTERTVSIKVSTQLRYKTLQTMSGERIEAVHDFSEVNVIDLYTTRRGKYLGRVREIVERRLKKAGIQATPEEFFPSDADQESAIKRIEQEILLEWPSKGRGHRARDDVQRYARPTYIAALRGQRKAGHTYSYSGFEQLVHVSSGIVRFFLEPAARMYLSELSSPGQESPRSISPTTQNEILREDADRLLLGDFDKVFSEAERSSAGDEPAIMQLRGAKAKLHGLIRVLGGLFLEKLLDESASERRIFSVAFSETPDAELTDVLRLGIQFGYFHVSMIGNKDGTGRIPLYILTRRLAPHFTLDPTGFAGYFFMRPEVLWAALENPQAFLRHVKEKGIASIAHSIQLPLFSE